WSSAGPVRSESGIDWRIRSSKSCPQRISTGERLLPDFQAVSCPKAVQVDNLSELTALLNSFGVVRRRSINAPAPVSSSKFKFASFAVSGRLGADPDVTR